jgi:hypothetical protein
MDMEPFNYTVVQRRKREYLTKFEQIASEVPNIEELYKILSMSHKLFMDLLVVILVIIV